MQIFDDKKKRIGFLTGFKERSITTALDTGDKELSFEYPANGRLVELLKEEYYIRTKTDEFVLKAVETGEQFNKYTAVLNVEELEGTAFPYGFESQEQTIRACLTFAFEGTEWTVRTCTVTKKRTINEERSVTAWDVLQKCLTTYRCECVIDSLNKVIDIYERIGSDKGCYFIEGLNLRKLSLKSDTYEFYTRIYPIGKNGITPEWLLGHDYIDNFQYSSKVKSFTWKDERYTNTTSLIEDATAKLEEASRPYKAFTVEVADLAKANEKYKEILSYGIGDIITLVSKKTRTKEKQRIVKITVFPEEKEKNTVEISNARKTFAQMQQEETKSATEEAVSISNRTTKKVLENYSTTEETETKITASKEAIELGVMHTLEHYYDKTETDTQIKLSKDEIELKATKKYQTKAEMEEYSTEMKAEIDIRNDEIIKLVEQEEQRANEEEKKLSAVVTQTAQSITQEVKRATEKEGELSSSIKQTTQSITTKVTKGEVSSQISQEAGAVSIKANRLEIESDALKIKGSGAVTSQGSFSTARGKYGDNDYGKVTLSGGKLTLLKSDPLLGDANIEAYSMTGDDGDKKYGIRIYSWGSFISLSDNIMSDWDYMLNSGTDPYGFTEKHLFRGDISAIGIINTSGIKWHGSYAELAPGTITVNSVNTRGTYVGGSLGVDGDFVVTGKKSRVVKTKDYGDVSMNAWETPGAFFSDLGGGVIGEDGTCYVYYDSIFAETICEEQDCYVMCTQTSKGRIEYIEKKKGYIIVHGTAGTTFDWIMTAGQKDYECERMERVAIQHEEDKTDETHIFEEERKIQNTAYTEIAYYTDTIDEEAEVYLNEYEREIESYD